MMRTIHLHGSLGEKFGHQIRLDVQTIPEAVRALTVVLPGFREEFQFGAWHVVVGKTVETGLDLDIEGVEGFNLGSRDLHFVPALVGAKRGGLLKVVMGVALMGLSFGFTGGIMGAAVFGTTTVGSIVGTLGLSLAVAGISTMLAPEMEAENDEESFLMTGPTNAGREGSIVPIVYGEVITGGVLISAEMDIDQLKGEDGQPINTALNLFSKSGEQGATSR